MFIETEHSGFIVTTFTPLTNSGREHALFAAGPTNTSRAFFPLARASGTLLLLARRAPLAARGRFCTKTGLPGLPLAERWLWLTTLYRARERAPGISRRTLR